MAGKVFFSVSMSLDGFIAPESLGDLMGQQWMELQQWIFPQRFFRENLKLGEGGEEGLDNDIARATYERTGASVMGKRMFDGGERAWPEEAPFHTPVFVVTHTKRDPWERPGGTPSALSTTASRARCSRHARPPATVTCASRAAPRRFRSTWTAAASRWTRPARTHRPG